MVAVSIQFPCHCFRVFSFSTIIVSGGDDGEDQRMIRWSSHLLRLSYYVVDYIRGTEVLSPLQSVSGPVGRVQGH